MREKGYMKMDTIHKDEQLEQRKIIKVKAPVSQRINSASTNSKNTE